MFSLSFSLIDKRYKIEIVSTLNIAKNTKLIETEVLHKFKSLKFLMQKIKLKS